jgi:hypothetical protein
VAVFPGTLILHNKFPKGSIDFRSQARPLLKKKDSWSRYTFSSSVLAAL